jgi:methylglutaconyl-CoA hydratase
MSLVNLSCDARGIARLVLNRPEKLNAFSKELCHSYLQQLDVLEKDIDARRVLMVVIESASPKAFCAGADLKERQAMNEKEISDQLITQRKMMDGTAALEVPTVALLNGAAFGGGLELALACDFRLAKPGALMGLSELRLGIIPGSGGTQRLTRLVGLAKAKELIHLAKKIDAHAAQDIGLVNEVGTDLDAILENYIEAVLATAPMAQRAAKKAIEGGLDADTLKEALDFERACYGMVLKTEDRVEGLNAFIEKREPSYKGQ